MRDLRRTANHYTLDFYLLFVMLLSISEEKVLPYSLRWWRDTDDDACTFHKCTV